MDLHTCIVGKVGQCSKTALIPNDLANSCYYALAIVCFIKWTQSNCSTRSFRQQACILLSADALIAHWPQTLCLYRQL